MDMETRVAELERKIGIVLDQLNHCSMTTDNRYGLLTKIESFEATIESVHKRLAINEADIKTIKEPIEARIEQGIAEGVAGVQGAVTAAVGEVVKKRRGRPPKQVNVG